MKQHYLTPRWTHFLFTFYFLFFTYSLYPQNQQPCITVRLSYRIFVNPKNGERPKINGIHSHEYLTDEIIQKAVDEMNDLFNTFNRGLIFDLDEIKEIGYENGSKTEAGNWFHFNFTKDHQHIDKKKELEKTAQLHRDIYGWRDDAINFYINQGTQGGLWHLGNMIIMGAGISAEGWRHLHELGHYFGLSHTHGFQCGLPQKGKSGVGHTEPGDDRIDDTVIDFPNWDRNEIAKHNFDRKYHQLNEKEKEQVDNVAENLMSYHFIEPINAKLTRLTKGQLDRFMDRVNSFAIDKIREGRIWVVGEPRGVEEGTFLHPFASIELAIGRANPNGGDILFLDTKVKINSVPIDKSVIFVHIENQRLTTITPSGDHCGESQIFAIK